MDNANKNLSRNRERKIGLRIKIDDIFELFINKIKTEQKKMKILIKLKF